VVLPETAVALTSGVSALLDSVAPCAQERTGWVRLGIDTVLFVVALALLAPAVILWSLPVAVIGNGMIAINHRCDRYIAT